MAINNMDAGSSQVSGLPQCPHLTEDTAWSRLVGQQQAQGLLTHLDSCMHC